MAGKIVPRETGASVSGPSGRRALSVDDLPEGVLTADLAVGELEEVAAADFDGLPGRLGTADRPFGHAAVAARPMAVILVPDVGNPVEPRLDPRPDLVPAGHSTPSRPGSARHVQHAVLGEEGHD